MKWLNKIIKEEYQRFLKENYDDEDVDWSFYERMDEIKQNIFYDFLYKNNQNFTKHVPWQVIPFPRLKKIWNDFMSTGIVRDTRGLEAIEDLMIENTLKVNTFTTLGGHTPQNPDDDWEEYVGTYVDRQIECYYQKPIDKHQLEIPFSNPKKGYVQKPQDVESCNQEVHPYIREFIEEHTSDNVDVKDLRSKLIYELSNRFFDYYMNDEEGEKGGFISDYGLEPLMTLLSQLRKETRPEDKLVTIDKMLNVVHQRSDIAKWFVEGGSRALAQLSSSPSEVPA
jgi:hypothetical protein